MKKDRWGNDDDGMSLFDLAEMRILADDVVSRRHANPSTETHEEWAARMANTFMEQQR